MEKETWYWIVAVIVGLVLYKIFDMHTLQWFGDEWYIKSSGSSFGGWGEIIGFFFAAAFFWSLVAIIVIPTLQFLGIIKK